MESIMYNKGCQSCMSTDGMKHQLQWENKQELYPNGNLITEEKIIPKILQWHQDANIVCEECGANNWDIWEVSINFQPLKSVDNIDSQTSVDITKKWTLTQFQEYYVKNRETMNLQFCRPIIERRFTNEQQTKIQSFFAFTCGILYQNINTNDLHDGITNDLTNILFRELLQFEDITTFSQESHHSIEGVQNGKFAIKETQKTGFTHNHFELISYGVMVNCPISESRYCLFLQLTNSMWAKMIIALADICGSDDDITVQHFDDVSWYYYLSNSQGVEITAEMTEGVYRLYFFLNGQKGS